ncbi:MAG: hypothetical protein ACYCSN_11420 [Acidobacteriaceae bacterium]
MKIRATVLMSSTLLLASILGGCHTMPTATEYVHVNTSFSFSVSAPFARTALLFGPESEKSWAGDSWQPRFFYPKPDADIEGAVFTVQHGPHTSIWVNTVYDVSGGRMQYVAIIPEVVATTIDVQLTSAGQYQTQVDVTYVRTALDTAANDDVRGMARHDAISGPEWKRGIEGLLSASASSRR